EKEARKRYGSALLLAEDLRRFQSGQPIQARPVGWRERTVKWARRRPAAAALIAVSAVAALSLAIGGWGAAGALGRAAERRNNARLQAEANFAKAVAAVEHMLSDVGAVDLADVPQLEPVRKRLLLKAKAFFDEFLAENREDPGLRHLAGG